MFSIRKIFAKKENVEGNIAINREINQGGVKKMLPIRKINTMEHKKMQELQNKIMGQRRGIGLTKGITHDIRKRQFIKKGILGIIMGIGIAVFSKIARADGGFINYQGGKTAFEAPAAGIITMPSQPAFLAINSVGDTNQTGNGAEATVDFDSEIFDQNADFATDTFTAPVTGRYLLQTIMRVSGITSAADQWRVRLVTSNRTYLHTEIKTNNLDGTDSKNILAVADMDAGDTVTVTVTGTGESSDVWDIDGTNNETYFSGILLA